MLVTLWNFNPEPGPPFSGPQKTLEEQRGKLGGQLFWGEKVGQPAALRPETTDWLPFLGAKRITISKDS